MTFIKNIKKLFQHFRQSEEANSAVEFALIAPVLVLMVAGTVDIGMFIWERMQIQNAAHSVTEYVSLSQLSDINDTRINTVLTESYSGDIEDLTITASFECECADAIVTTCPAICEDENDYSRRFVSFIISSDFSAIFPYPGIPDSITIQRQARMRVD